MKCDLHLHSTCSDGIFSPEELITFAHEKGLDCVAITDHDTVAGVQRAIDKAKQFGIHCLVGTELSCFGSCEVHILAYNVDYNSPDFAEEMAQIASYRQIRNKQIVQKLHEHGIDIDLDKLGSQGSVGRGGMAREIVRLGYCQTGAEVFENYLGTGKCCYVQSKRLTPVEAIQFALRHGGIPVLAHPKQLHLGFDEFEKFVKPLVLAGLGGIEACYFTHNNAERKFYCKIARKYKLVITGGSDFHDYSHGVTIGDKSFSPDSYTRTILGI